MKYHNLRPGDKITPIDDRNDCLKKGHSYEVFRGGDCLYIKCDRGEHYLDAECDNWRNGSVRGKVAKNAELKGFKYV